MDIKVIGFFENYWQSDKVYEDISIEEYKKYWKELKQAKRRYPNSKTNLPNHLFKFLHI